MDTFHLRDANLDSKYFTLTQQFPFHDYSYINVDTPKTVHLST